jgi:hypothetical protein
VIEGEGANVTVFIPKQVVSYTWVVVPTQIEDKYIFILEATFETYVPIPGTKIVSIEIFFSLSIFVIYLNSDYCGTFPCQYR